MDARRISSCLRPKFNMNWTAGVPVKVGSQRNGEKKIGAKFSRVSLRAKHWGRPSRFWCATKMRVQKTTLTSRRNFGPRTPTLPMKRSMEFETGRVAAALQRGRQLAG